MLLERFSLLLIASFTAAQSLDSSFVVVNCTWPCANSSDVCVITHDDIRCHFPEPHQYVYLCHHNGLVLNTADLLTLILIVTFFFVLICNDSTGTIFIFTFPCPKKRWVMTVLDHSPTFSGKPTQLSEPCQQVPVPALQHFNITPAINTTSTTVIQWPPSEDPYHPLDEYLGNCVAKAYCSPFDSTCHLKLEDGQTCNSTNQCLESQCIDGRCQASWKLWSSSEAAQQASSGFNTIHVIAGVIGITGLIIIATVSVLVFRRRRRNEQKKKDETLPVSMPYPSSPGTGLRTYYTNPRHMSFATFANDFNSPTSESVVQTEHSGTVSNNESHINTTRPSVYTFTPAMQQLHLQMRLQQELRSHETQQVDQPGNSRPHHQPKELPPPPYEP